MKTSQWSQVVLAEPTAKIKILSPHEQLPLKNLHQQDIDLDFLSTRSLPHHLTILPYTDGSVFCRLDISHAVMDGAAMEHILRDWALAYDGHLPSSISASTYALYMEFLKIHPRSTAQQYWRGYLADATPYKILSNRRSGTRGIRVHKMQQVDPLPSFQEFCSSRGYNNRFGCQSSVGYSPLRAYRKYGSSVRIPYQWPPNSNSPG